LLPHGQNPDRKTYHLDLTGASLEYFRLSEGTRIGRLTARQARFYGITRLSEMHISGPALFSRATFLGRVDLSGTQFEGGLSFQETTFHDEVCPQGGINWYLHRPEYHPTGTTDRHPHDQRGNRRQGRWQWLGARLMHCQTDEHSLVRRTRS
jgi:pentapeptide repeat protein